VRSHRLSSLFLLSQIVFTALGSSVSSANLLSSASVSFVSSAVSVGGCTTPPVNVPAPIASSSCSDSKSFGFGSFDGSTSAIAQYGGLRILDTAALSSPGGQNEQSVSTSQARLTDTLTIMGAGAAFLAIVGEVSGSQIATGAGVLFGGQGVFEVDLSGANPTSTCGVSLPTASNATTKCTTPLYAISSGSTVGLQVVLGTSVAVFTTSGMLAAGSGNIAGDYSHTGQVVGVEVFDANLNLLKNVTVTTGSGFTYPLGVPAGAIPEPGSLFLFVSGAVGLAGMTWRRRRK
jgi:hypothetical protein